MRYFFNHDRFNNFSYFQENKLDARSYFVPFASLEDCKASDDILKERYDTKLNTILNGKWDFAYFDNIKDMPMDIDTYDYPFDTVKVPGCWQFQGYDKPCYVNQRYMFDYKPPYVPAEDGIYGVNTPIQVEGPVNVHNSVAIYRKQFRMVRSKRHILTFLGVASCAQVYFNGRYVGYSEGSHNTAEFDVTDYVIDGPNEVVVLVYKWCNGTYLECQDMFRNNGIFRDVYVTSYDENYIEDYVIKTKKAEVGTWVIEAECFAHLDDKSEIHYELYDGNRIIGKATGEKATLGINNAKIWSAETPYLYTLFIYIKRGTKSVFAFRQEVGLREIAIIDSVFYFNGKPIKMKGVNHHDTNPKTGYYMTPENYLEDLKLMKELNVNAIRTSHYPPDPIMLKLANQLGFYVVDEADIETHGTYGKKIPQPNNLSNNVKWKEHYWDRVYRMFMRDRNNVCVTMWSLGNEAGGWKNQDYCYANLKALDEIVPIHYEGVIRTPRWAYDVVSQMYTFTGVLEKYCDHKLPAKWYRAPFFLCEYAHAMGVGPANIDRYMDMFYKMPTMLGGCIWEWADHAVLHKDGTYTYGGDHGEYAHDKNFCVDGLVFPDRTCSTGALEMQNVYRPIRASYISNNKYILTNTNAFADSSNIEINWTYTINGEVLAQGKVDGVIPPASDYIIPIKHPTADTARDCFINFIYNDKTTGKLIAKEQIVLSQLVETLPEVSAGPVAYIEENGLSKVKFNNGQIVFDRSNGRLISYNVDEKERVLSGADTQGFQPCVYRPMIDNYMYMNNVWVKQGLDKTQFVLDSFDGNKKNGNVEIKVVFKLVLQEKVRMYATNIYTIYGNGQFDVDTTLEVARGFDLPKYGLTIELPSEYNNVRYYGQGDRENYSDFKCHSIIGIYEMKGDEMYEQYIKPQDSGNRGETRWATLLNDNGDGIEINASNKAFNFSVQPFDDKAVMEAKHKHELKHQDKLVVKIDGFMRGIGTNSCGEDTRSEYRHTSTRPINYKFRISPITNGKKLK